MNIFVGNIPFGSSADDIRQLFEQYGTVENVNMITDRETGRFRGFGFVEMVNGGNEAIAALHETDLEGRTLTVNHAKPREQRQPRRW